MTTTTFSVATLLAKAGTSMPELELLHESLFGAFRRQLEVRGDEMDAQTADRLAVRLHLHPGNVWPEWWDVEWTPETPEEITAARRYWGTRKSNRRRSAKIATSKGTRRPNRVRFEPENAAELIARYLAGEAETTLAEEMNISRRAFKRFLVREGVARRNLREAAAARREKMDREYSRSAAA